MISRSEALWPGLTASQHQGLAHLCADSAKGVRIQFADGSECIDGKSGLWNVNLGYGNPVIADAVGEALHRASYLSVFRYENTYAREAARALLQVAGTQRYRRVIFSTSGSAANDLAMKLVRQYHEINLAPKRKVVLGLQGSYHGMTFGGMAITGEDLRQGLYGVDQRLVAHVPPNDLEACSKAFERLGHRIAAVVVEPVLGNGAVCLDPDFLQLIFKARAEFGFLVVADEVATGFGRTGPMFATSPWHEAPDILILSKGLTNGTSAAAVVMVSTQVAAPFDQSPEMVFVHAETQAGTPPTAAAILATLTEFERLEAVRSGEKLSGLLDDLLSDLESSSTFVESTQGVGCFRSIRVCDEQGRIMPLAQVPELVNVARAHGVIVHPSPNGVQILPALTMSDSDLRSLLGRIATAIEAHMSRSGSGSL